LELKRKLLALPQPEYPRTTGGTTGSLICTPLKCLPAPCAGNPDFCHRTPLAIVVRDAARNTAELAFGLFATPVALTDGESFAHWHLIYKNQKNVF
jgi:hypothetical protein